MLVPLPFAEVIRFRAELGEQVTGNLVMDAQKAPGFTDTRVLNQIRDLALNTKRQYTTALLRRESSDQPSARNRSAGAAKS
jgi:hypothetical protein